ncbi:hypothetical protein NQ315_003325 [Exocentrus adspersus]|uniref:Tyr recombinase domain-containing protein n=1 Tax=Exocentrus adspersus TaxID=1586481 RepID=A0AAV8VCU2_9CUCU|nr:hypothetical protein NQ315_003325 [Exocentrus adspersus]
MENFELEDAVKEVMDGILPKKSRKIYEAQYDTFVKWCCQRKLENVNEDVLLVFFAEKSKTLSSSTLWAHYSMLKTMLNVKRNIDVALIFGVAGACRGKELHELTISDVTDMDHALLVNVRNTKNNVDRNFIINNSNKNGIDLIEVCRKYMALRKPETTHSRFFVRYEKSQCTVQAIGKNTFWKNTTKKLSASLLADSGASIDVLKRHGGWKSASVGEGYIENSINTKYFIHRIAGQLSQWTKKFTT